MSLQVTLKTDGEDLDAMAPIGKLIWDSVFKKPPPVTDIKAWSVSGESDEYVYIPNNLAKEGDEVEAFIANAHYTEVLTEAYRTMCEAHTLSPYVALQDGSTAPCAMVRGCHGAQYRVAGEKAGRLANSTLIDFDDSGYAEEFIKHIMSLGKDQYENEVVLRRVLAKVEHILMGRSSHTYNQRFIQRFLDILDEGEGFGGGTKDKLLSVFQTMTQSGHVLEDSIDEFTSRCSRAGLLEHLPSLEKIFRGSCGSKR